MDIGNISRAGSTPLHKTASNGEVRPVAEADSPDVWRDGYASALTTISSGSLAAAYKAMRSYDGVAAMPSVDGNALFLAERARAGDVAQALASPSPVIGSAVGIPGAFAAYAQVLGD